MRKNKMANKKKHEDHVNMERWLISYADFITLLFILFIILYSFSQIDMKKYKQVAQSLASEFSGGGNSALDGPGGSGSGSGSDSGSQKEDAVSQENQALTSLAREIDIYAKENGISANIEMRSNETGLYISLTGTVLFQDASATLTPEAKEFINTIFYRLKPLPNHILIEGHTDNRPIKSTEFPSNWELSAARSINLVRYLIEGYNFEPQRLSSAAYGQYRPVASNETPEGQSKNRRVEIIILKAAQETAQEH